MADEYEEYVERINQAAINIKKSVTIREWSNLKLEIIFTNLA